MHGDPSFGPMVFWFGVVPPPLPPPSLVACFLSERLGFPAFKGEKPTSCLPHYNSKYVSLLSLCACGKYVYVHLCEGKPFLFTIHLPPLPFSSPPSPRTAKWQCTHHHKHFRFVLKSMWLKHKSKKYTDTDSLFRQWEQALCSRGPPTLLRKFFGNARDWQMGVYQLWHSQ